jgi:uncharacterized membrane protein
LIDRETSVIVLAIITILCVFVAVQPIIPYSSEHYSSLGILGPQQKIANYPTNLTRGESFVLYAFVQNHEGKVEYYQLLVKLGNSTTQVSNSTASNAPVIASYSYVLNNGQNTTFPMNLSIDQAGINLRLIFELWTYDTSSSSFVFLQIQPDQLFVNVTSI